MRIAVHSASAAVTRTLEAIITTGGHALVSSANAELIVCDMLHPKALPETPARILSLVTKSTPNGITCPVRPAQLLRQLTAQNSPPQIAIGGGWNVDFLGRNLTHPNAPAVALTEKECALLKTLATAHPAALGRDALLTEVWGITSDIDTHTLETHIYRLRSKLGGLSPAAGDIVTEAGAYRLAKA